ncbi:MAG: hypothetical protein RIQ63_527 [Actinomycetota bacterium]
MTPRELVAQVCPLFNDTGWAYYFTPDTQAKGAELGLKARDVVASSATAMPTSSPQRSAISIPRSCAAHGNLRRRSSQRVRSVVRTGNAALTSDDRNCRGLRTSTSSWQLQMP